MTRISSSTQLLDTPETTAVIVCIDDLPVASAAQVLMRKTGVSREKLELITKNMVAEKLLVEENGVYKLTEKYVRFHDRKSKNLRQKTFIRSQMQKSVLALETKYAKDAKFFCNTFTISNAELETLQERVADWIDDLMMQTNLQKPERVVQLNLQLFPFF